MLGMLRGQPRPHKAGHDLFSKLDHSSVSRLATGDIGRQLLDGDGFARVQQVIHLPERVLAVVVQCLVCCGCRIGGILIS